MKDKIKDSNKKIQKRNLIIQTALELFAKNGFYKTNIPTIADKMKMSVGNLYNYFSSKDVLAQEIMKYTSEFLGKRIKVINDSDDNTKNKIHRIVETYFGLAEENPAMIEYFLRVYLSNREVFGGECQGSACVSGFITEIMILFDNGVENKELRNQDFFSAFGLFMGYLGGMVFLSGEDMLPKKIEDYIDDISSNIFNALKA